MASPLRRWPPAWLCYHPELLLRILWYDCILVQPGLPPGQCSGQRGLHSLVTALRRNCEKQVEQDSLRQTINSSSPSDPPPPGFGLHQKITKNWVNCYYSYRFFNSHFSLLAFSLWRPLPFFLYDPCGLAYCYVFIRLLPFYNIESGGRERWTPFTAD